MPFFVVSREIAPKEFLENPEDFSKTFFTASITNWNAHSRLPLAQVTGKLGQMGELPIETQALLADAGVTWNDFDDVILKDLPATVFFGSSNDNSPGKFHSLKLLYEEILEMIPFSQLIL